MDPVGFEPTISCLQSRRLPAWPRARTLISSADERTRTSTPFRAIDPKSIASANSATSASIPASYPAPIEQSSLASHLRLSKVSSFVKPTFEGRCTPDSVIRNPAGHTLMVIICLGHLCPAVCNLLGVTQLHPHRCDEILHHLRRLCKTHSPCSPLHARPAGFVSKTAGGLLPHRFTPNHPVTLQCPSGRSAFCCGCSHIAVTGHAPPLTVSWGNIPTTLHCRRRG